MSAPPNIDVLTAQYNDLLKNFKLQHVRIETQMAQVMEQEKQNANLRQYVSLLEGGDNRLTDNGVTVDDFHVKNKASVLASVSTRWASDAVLAAERTSPGQGARPLIEALCVDMDSIGSCKAMQELQRTNFSDGALSTLTRNYLLHTVSTILAESLLNTMPVTQNLDVNTALTQIHETLFQASGRASSVWRRQSMSTAPTALSEEITGAIFAERIPTLQRVLGPNFELQLREVLSSGQHLARLIHGIVVSTPDGEGYYSAFVPAIGEQINLEQVQLMRQCPQGSAKSKTEFIGVCLFPGLVKIIRGPNTSQASQILVVRKAQALCECCMLPRAPSSTRPPLPVPPMAAPRSSYADPGPRNSYASPPVAAPRNSYAEFNGSTSSHGANGFDQHSQSNGYRSMGTTPSFTPTSPSFNQQYREERPLADSQVYQLPDPQPRSRAVAYPAPDTSYQPSEASYEPSELSYEPSELLYESSDTSYQSPSTGYPAPPIARSPPTAQSDHLSQHFEEPPPAVPEWNEPEPSQRTAYPSEKGQWTPSANRSTDWGQGSTSYQAQGSAPYQSQASTSYRPQEKAGASGSSSNVPAGAFNDAPPAFPTQYHSPRPEKPQGGQNYNLFR